MVPSRLSDSERAHLLDSSLAGSSRPFPVYDELSYDDFLPNLDALRAYADQVVPVADTSAREFSEFERSDRPLGDVLDLWEQGDGKSLYVKDWHLIAELCERGGAAKDVYEPPACFLDDWLSPPFSLFSAGEMPASLADFRFVYLGPGGTFTPLHRDVYGSYSWSANVVGRKVWWLFPPGTETQLQEGSGLMFDVRGTEKEQLGVKIVQEEGEVIFVPSGWHHQVVNIDFEMTLANDRVKEAIEDVQADIKARLGNSTLPDGTLEWEAEWAAEVEGLLARDAGWGWEGFWACILGNMKRPPASPDLSPSEAERNGFIREVLDCFKSTREYTLLPRARETVREIEALLAP
ncbi:jumonji domain containing 4 [Trichosporon asahii var. asahii CBS 8904]|uniref:Jumonji domain containing 4 n=1 Tax=Trichosporon asahii var. asahii (strain CBS 8904) TaxID=1220162 RepID=K1V2V0_TRIAC|nr:jumonji domain containing 4 [Trichosporon asahii var. asahii CBS 8904]